MICRVIVQTPNPRSMLLIIHHPPAGGGDNDKFGSRKGIEEGSITIHPLGIPHGPQPGAVEASIGAKHTEELAVMVDTHRPFKLTKYAMEIEDPDYWKSWQTRG